MFYKKAVWLLAILLAGASCAGTRGLRYTSPTFEPAAHPNLSYTPPLSAIKLLVGDQQEVRPDRFLSAMVARQTCKALLLHSVPLHLLQEVRIDSLQRPALLREVGAAVQQLAQRQPVDSLQLPLLSQLLRQQAPPAPAYTLILLSRGFTRSSDNFARAGSRGGHAMALYGTGSMPVKSMTTVYALIYDRQQQRLVYVRESTESHEPLDLKRTARHIERLMSPDFKFGPG